MKSNWLKPREVAIEILEIQERKNYFSFSLLSVVFLRTLQGRPFQKLTNLMIYRFMCIQWSEY